jgi:hypothetical protein
MKAPWEFEHAGKLTQEQKTHPVQTRDYPYQEANEKWWVNDLECPYTEERFDWYRGFQVGGKSLTWGDKVTDSVITILKIIKRWSWK